MHKNGVNRFAHHFTSAMPGWPGPKRFTHSPPSSCACANKAPVVHSESSYTLHDWGELHAYAVMTAPAAMRWHGMRKLHEPTLPVIPEQGRTIFAASQGHKAGNSVTPGQASKTKVKGAQHALPTLFTIADHSEVIQGHCSPLQIAQHGHSQHSLHAAPCQSCRLVGCTSSD